MAQTSTARVPILLIAVGGAVGLLVALAGSLLLGFAAGLVALGLGLLVVRLASKARASEPADPSRRRFLTLAGLGGLAWVVVGPPIGWTVRKVARPDPRPIQEAMAHDMGAEYMEMVMRDYHPGRSGDLQLLLAPFNSANYSNESLSLVPRDPRTSHASTWMYLERIPLVVHAPGRITPQDSTERVTLADLAPTAATFLGMRSWPTDRAGKVLPGLPQPGDVAGRRPLKVIVTYVFDGGGWNMLERWQGQWPTLKRLMSEGANYRNAVQGSYPAVTATGHANIGTGTFPSQHGITGHNIRKNGLPEKAYGTPGAAEPGDILVPTLADLWYEESQGKAWVGQLGYQVWHMGMLGYGGRNRTDGSKPVGVFWDEDYHFGHPQKWQPHNPDLFRLPGSVPARDVYDGYLSDFVAPTWDSEFTPGPNTRAAPCCSPPIVQYQGDLIQATFDSEPLGQGESTDLLYINFKSTDYTGHVYGSGSKWTGLQLEAVDTELERLVTMLDRRFPGQYVLFVTADHGQCPLPDSVGGVRLDPIQLDGVVEQHFKGLVSVAQNVVPSEIYLDTTMLRDNGDATPEDVAVALKDYRYRDNIGPYVPRSAIEEDLLNQKEFSAVFATSYLDTLVGTDLSRFGATAFPEGDTQMPGLPETYL